MSRYDNHTRLDQGEIVMVFGVAECIVAIIGVIATMIGVGLESIVLQIFGGACLTAFVIGLTVAAFISIGMYRRAVATDKDPETE